MSAFTPPRREPLVIPVWGGGGRLKGGIMYSLSLHTKKGHHRP